MQALISENIVVVFLQQLLEVEVNEPLGAPGRIRLCFPGAKNSVLLHLLPSLSNTTCTGIEYVFSVQGLSGSARTAVRVIKDIETIQ